MKMQKKEFALMKFTCIDCSKLNELKVTGVHMSEKHNHTCKCGTRYWVNRIKCRVEKIGGTK